MESQQQTPYETEPPQITTSSTLATAVNEPTHVSPGVIVLQWFVYAFWGWTVIALSWLTSIVFTNLIDKSAYVVDMLPYAISAIAVLLPLAVICDAIYSRHEPARKKGVALAVVLTHVVIFTLFGVGSLIGAVFAFVQLAIGDNQTSSLATALSLLVITILFAATLLRTFRPRGIKWIVRVYIIFMSAVAILFIILGIVGPLASARELKNDRLIENNLNTIQSSIDSYVDTNKKLPASLADISAGRDAKQLIDSNLIEYKNEGEVPSDVIYDSPSSSKTSIKLNTDANKTFHYQLCATYKKAANTNSYDTAIQDDYGTYAQTYNHPAGHVCYKLEKTIYSSSYDITQ